MHIEKIPRVKELINLIECYEKVISEINEMFDALDKSVSNPYVALDVDMDNECVVYVDRQDMIDILFKYQTKLRFKLSEAECELIGI